jgi:1-acyl-sn-glycerol-3-phosphate acyltransferase
MAAPRAGSFGCGGDAAPRITLADVDASLEPVAPFEIEDESAAATEEGTAAATAFAFGTPALPPPRPAGADDTGAADATALTAPPFFDPWLNDRAPMTWQGIALALLVVPPRVAVCIALAAAALPLSIALFALAAALPVRHRNSARVRAVVVAPIRFLCRLALLGAGFFWITTSGRSPADARTRAANIVVANHSSVADVLWAVWAFAPAFLAKSEALRIPYVGAAARALGCVFVSRGDAASRAAARAAIAAIAAAPPGAAPPLLIFPEGTTTSGLCLIAWERGAFAPGAPVLPVAISYPKGQPKSDALFSIETLRAIARPRNRMHVAFLPPRAPSGGEARAPARFAAAVRSEVAAALGIPLCEQSYRDGIHRKRGEGPPPREGLTGDKAKAAAALRRAPPPLPFR